MAPFEDDEAVDDVEEAAAAEEDKELSVVPVVSVLLPFGLIVAGADVVGEAAAEVDDGLEDPPTLLDGAVQHGELALL